MLMTKTPTTAASIIDIKIGKKCEREREGPGSNGEKRKSNSANQQISAVKSHRVCLPVIVCVCMLVYVGVCVCVFVGACGQPLWLCGSLGYNVI